MENYTQCFLSKIIDTIDGKEDGLVCTTAWIPEEYAVVDKLVKIKDNGVWSDGWNVRMVWTTRPKDWVEQHQRDYLHQRKASDI